MNNLLTVENLPSRTRQLILQKAEGNPFFLEEIMRTLVDRGAVRSENGRWRATSSIETITIPDTIHGVIMARIDRLDDELKDVLKAASVIGRAFLYRLLKEVTDAIKQLDHHLDTLAATELIREKQKVPELEYIFKHALVQESTYESILLKKRMELHGKVASAIEKLLSDRLDELASILAYHYAKAESWEKAQEYLFKAGDQAGRIAADAEALTHYQQALETYARVFGDKWDPVKRGVLERKMGEAFYRRGEWEKAMEYLQRALVFFGQPKLATAPSKVKLATTKELCVQLFRRLFSRALTKRTYGPVDEAVEQVARIYDILATYYIVASPDHFLLTMLTYLNFSERKGYLPGIISPSASLAFVVSNFSLFRLSRSLLRRGEILTRQTEDLHAIGWLQFMSACITYNAGQLDKAIEHCLKTIEVSRMRGYWSLTHWGYLNHVLVYAYYLQGDMKNSPAIAREAIRIGEDANEPIIVAIGLDILGHVQEREGNFQECAVTLTRSMELFKAISDHGHVLWAGGSLGRCYCRMGDVERGLAVLRETDAYGTTHKIIQFRHFIALPLYMAYLAAADQDGQAKKDRLKKARQVGKRVFKLAKIYQVCLPRAERLEGIYDWLAEKQASAQKHWNRSLTLAEEMGMHYELGMTHLEMGRRLNDHEHLQKAGAIFAEIGAEGDLAETRRLLEGFQG